MVDLSKFAGNFDLLCFTIKLNGMNIKYATFGWYILSHFVFKKELLLFFVNIFSYFSIRGLLVFYYEDLLRDFINIYGLLNKKVNTLA